MSTYAYNGYHSSTVTQKRFTEADYMNLGVWGNKFQIVFDLLIKTPNDKTPRCVSVNTDFVVPVNSTITYSDDKTEKKEKTYEYNNQPKK